MQSKTAAVPPSVPAPTQDEADAMKGGPGAEPRVPRAAVELPCEPPIPTQAEADATKERLAGIESSKQPRERQARDMTPGPAASYQTR
jgi:hypothetical protein